MRTVFYISDRTAITAEAIGHSLLVQFAELQYRETTLSYIDSLVKAKAVVQQINQETIDNRLKPIVFMTVVKPDIREILITCNALILDPFDAFLAPLENELQIRPLHETGRSHRISDFGKYDIRIEAINFTLAHDDGASTAHYAQSDVILTGVSRCGKAHLPLPRAAIRYPCG